MVSDLKIFQNSYTCVYLVNKTNHYGARQIGNIGLIDYTLHNNSTSTPHTFFLPTNSTLY